MRNKKVIDPFLNKKIVENEKKIHLLFDTELNKSQSKRTISRPLNNPPVERNIHHKKYKSQDEIYINDSDDNDNDDNNEDNNDDNNDDNDDNNDNNDDDNGNNDDDNDDNDNNDNNDNNDDNNDNNNDDNNVNNNDDNNDDNNGDNNEISQFKSTIDINPYSMTIQNGEDNASSSYINRNGKTKNVKNNIIKQRQNRNINNIKQRQDRNNKKMHYPNSNSEYQLTTQKSKKVYNKDEVNNIVNRLYNNYYKYKKKPYRDDKEKETSTIDFSLNTDTNETPVKKPNEHVNVNQMIERFQEDIKKRNKRMEQKREEILNNEKKIYTHKPKLNKKSKQIESGNKESFLERQKKFEEKAKQKEERFKADLQKKEEEKLNKNSYVYKKKKNKKDDEKTNIQTTIKGLYEWEKTRQKKLETKQKEKKKPDEQNTFRPKINKKSCSMAKSKNRDKDPDVFSRLAQEDKLLKEKKQVLINLYTPTFQPNILEKRKKIQKRNYMNSIDEKYYKKPKKSKKFPKDSDDEDEEDEDDESEDSEDSEEDEENEEDEFDYKQDPKVFAEDDVQDALRKALLNKMKH